jgi:hypothetical protein
MELKRLPAAVIPFVSFLSSFWSLRCLLLSLAACLLLLAVDCCSLAADFSRAGGSKKARDLPATGLLFLLLFAQLVLSALFVLSAQLFVCFASLSGAVLWFFMPSGCSMRPVAESVMSAYNRAG